MEVNELFDLCRELAATEPSGAALRRMHQLLVLSCGSQQGLTFGNLFAQIDWLCKHHGLSIDDTIALQTARRHSNQTEPPSREDWLYDLRAVARFISTLTGQAVPGSLLRLLPATGRSHDSGPKTRRQAVRCVVDHFDATTIWADTDDGPIEVDYSAHDYLGRLLRQGMQLNVIDDRLIIVEPDFLVDISSLAACFTNYGHHPLLYTLNRLRPRPNTQATLLGNFAGTALDALIHDPQATTAAVLRRSFREQALRFAACADMNPQLFKQQAEEQMQNLRQATAQLRSPSPLVLEPSFVCERLGLQGRVDLMTADMSLLVEQKSGRNPKIERRSHDSHGLQLESHYVQLLLYYAVLRYNFGKSERQVDTRLLYSRYPARQGLLVVNYYRALLGEALRLRNQIVATELFIAREGFGRILPLLRTDVIYEGVQRDEPFHRYVEPELARLTAQLSSLTPLERAYYTTMLTFVYREQCCQKLGSASSQLYHSGGSTADLWQMPLTEKLATGNIYVALTMTQRAKSDPDAGYDLLTLSMQPVAMTVSNFRQGDMVFLYRYDSRKGPDARRSILYKGVLCLQTDDSLTVQLTDGQQNADLFPIGDGATWALEHGSADAGTNSAIRGLHQLVTGDQRRRQLLLGQRRPEADTSLRLSRAYNPAYDDIVLRQKQARDYFLLQGPPGTGKTSMALRFMVLEELSAPGGGGAVLLTAYTKRAVDEICAMLDDAHVGYMRITGDSVPAHLTTLDDLRRSISTTPVVVGTTSMLQAHPYILQVKRFTLCIVDEASQLLEPALVGLLATDGIGRFVLVGDHKQLPAVVQQGEADARVDDPQLRRIGITDCRQSLFERLLGWEHSQGCTQFTGVLSRQGRMHPAVAQFPSTHFYQREHLDVVPCPHQQEQAMGYTAAAPDDLDRLLSTRRTLFLPVVPEELPQNDQSNDAEARLVARIADYYGDRFDPEKTIGIIVPYRAQIATIRQYLSVPLSIDTVERYQGSQRDVIIYATTISRRYQLDFLTQSTIVEDGRPIDRKLNVALTRARRQMIVVGNPDVLRYNPLYRQFISLNIED